MRAGVNLQFMPLSLNFVPYCLTGFLADHHQLFAGDVNVTGIRLARWRKGLAWLLFLIYSKPWLLLSGGWVSANIMQSHHIWRTLIIMIFVNVFPSSSTTVETNSYLWAILSWQQLRNKYLTKLITRLSRLCQSNAKSKAIEWIKTTTKQISGIAWIFDRAGKASNIPTTSF
jgi:hypothetical protein